MECCTPFVTYRFLLYTDNFKVSPLNYVQKLLGGVYLLPCSEKARIRPTSANIHRAASTTPQFQSKSVLSATQKDLVQGIHEGFTADGPYGRSILVFLDCIWLNADFRESVDGFDVENHRSNTGCTNCSFQKQACITSNVCKFAYTNCLHSGNASSQRTANRHPMIDHSNLSEDDRKFLRLRPHEDEGSEENPLLNLLCDLRGSTIYNNPAKTHFDAFRRNIVSPNHVFARNIRKNLDFTLKSLKKPDFQTHLNAVILNNLKASRMHIDGSIFNVEEWKAGRIELSVFLPTYSAFEALWPSLLQTKEKVVGKDQAVSLLYELVNALSD